jgi:hypothetical protein
MTEDEAKKIQELSAAVTILFDGVPNNIMYLALHKELQKRELVMCRYTDLAAAYNTIQRIHDSQHTIGDAYRSITNAINGYIR